MGDHCCAKMEVIRPPCSSAAAVACAYTKWRQLLFVSLSLGYQCSTTDNGFSNITANFARVAHEKN